ncbi:hypothetical protein ACFFJB_02035 [Camelimonas abortus]
MLDWEQASRSWMVKTTVDLQRKVTTVEQETADAFARVQDDMSAVVGAGEALASRVTAVEAGVGANAAAIISEQTARANGDSALASSISSLTATVSSNTAAITAEQTARANGDSALASSISSLSTTVGGHTASISSLMTSVNGLGVQYAVQGYVGGSYGGFVFTGVKRADGAGATYLLEITSNVVINGDLLVTGTVFNDKLSDSAVSRAWAAEGGTSASITPTFRGTGFLEIYAQFKGDANAYAAIDQFVLRVREDGNIISDTPINHAQNGTGSSAASRYGATSIIHVRTPSAGSHTYSVELVKTVAATGIHISGCLIIAKEFSK